MVRNDWFRFLSSKDYKDAPVILSFLEWAENCRWAIPTGFIEHLYEEGRSVCNEIDVDGWMQHVATDYVRPLDNLFDKEFVLGFTESTQHECLEIQALMGLMATAPNMPLGNHAELASRLAAAMTEVAKTFRTMMPEVKVPDDIWQIDVVGSKSDVRSIRATAKSSWFVLKPLLKENLVAGLSLWMHSLAYERESLNVDFNSYHFKTTGLFTRSRFQSLTTGKLYRFVRIVGSSDSSNTVQDIIRWMPKGKLVITSRYDDTWNAGTQSEPEFLGLLDYQLWPVFGLHYSAAYE